MYIRSFTFGYDFFCHEGVSITLWKIINENMEKVDVQYLVQFTRMN